MSTINFVLDCGGTCLTAFNVVSGEMSRVSTADLVTLNLPGLSDGMTVIIEDAHMRARQGNSLAQPYNYEQLITIKAEADRRNINVLLFPQKVTPAARTLFSVDEKSDEADTKSIANYLTINQGAFRALKKFNPVNLPEYQSTNSARWLDRSELSKDINVARGWKYGVKTDYSDGVTDWIYANSDSLLANPLVVKLLKLEKVYAGKPKEYLRIGNAMYSVVATLIKPSGELRLRSDNQKLPFWKYAKEVYFGMTPYHAQAGVCASNIKYHSRPSVSDFRKTNKSNPLTTEEQPLMAAARTQYDNELRDVWRFIRNLILSTNV
jgi:hypothetical protein